MANSGGASLAKGGSSRAARTKKMVLLRGRGERVTFSKIDRGTTEMRTSKGVREQMSAREGRVRAARLLSPAGRFRIAKSR
jgi:hypothetical protein